jgi:polyhydroxybutyrate depolymerase
MKKKIFYILFAMALCAAGTAHYLFQWNLFKPLCYGNISIDRIEREFYYYIPDKISEKPGLIFVLHGSTMSAKQMVLVTGHQFNKLADKYKNYIIVYPQGFQKYWNDCRKQYQKEKRSSLDDVAFFEKMIDFFGDKYFIDKTDVFAAGYSGGAQMCYRLAKEKPESFKGFAAISANLPVQTNNDCTESNQPVSMLVMNGTSDPIDPYNGGEMKTGNDSTHGTVVSTEQTIQYWKHISKCDSVPAKEFEYPDINADDHSTAVKYDYPCSLNNREITLIKINNGGHNVPNPTFFLWPGKVGNVNKDINAPEIVYDYFMSLK